MLWFRDEKKEFIRDKYIQHRFVAKTCARSAVTDDRPYELKCSIEAGELTGAVQMLGEDVDLGAILPGVVSMSPLNLYNDMVKSRSKVVIKQYIYLHHSVGW